MPCVLIVWWQLWRGGFGQRLLELALWRLHGVRVVRATLAEVHQGAAVDAAGALRYKGQEVQ